ncbi:MAG: hypothetical protein NOF05_09105 [Candidatus Accumulibacter phosphatis]|uniref:hypothetical protein n=1 Tax=Candidatus Accumulibacter TaxID=327159 RepID=UPI000626048B|nr:MULTISPECIES: hypothetical protein [Candidatus Accumulibacter]MBL8401722.1 hypothetical protein [Accumulibacter sp.]MCQ1548965.1 hypothetical protein [Candidatus Accumulibacter phosphatis]HMW56169.1 hypothetical protein [Accumulibacter sp.]
MYARTSGISNGSRGVDVVAFDNQAEPAAELGRSLPVSGQSVHELQWLGDIAGFDLTPGEHQNDWVGDSAVQALGHWGVVGVGSCGRMAADPLPSLAVPQ